MLRSAMPVHAVRVSAPPLPLRRVRLEIPRHYAWASIQHLVKGHTPQCGMVRLVPCSTVRLCGVSHLRLGVLHRLLPCFPVAPCVYAGCHIQGRVCRVALLHVSQCTPIGTDCKRMSIFYSFCGCFGYILRVLRVFRGVLGCFGVFWGVFGCFWVFCEGGGAWTLLFPAARRQYRGTPAQSSATQKPQ